MAVYIMNNRGTRVEVSRLSGRVTRRIARIARHGGEIRATITRKAARDPGDMGLISLKVREAARS